MEELLLNLRTYFIYFIHNVALSLCPHSQLAADPQALLQINTKHLWLYSFLSALLADPLYASLSLLIAHILSLPLSPLTPSEMLLCQLPAVELPAATAVAQAIPRLFEASKGVLGETKVGLIVRSINSILTQLARFGPSVIATLIKNGSGGSPVF